MTSGCLLVVLKTRLHLSCPQLMTSITRDLKEMKIPTKRSVSSQIRKAIKNSVDVRQASDTGRVNKTLICMDTISRELDAIARMYQSKARHITEAARIVQERALNRATMERQEVERRFIEDGDKQARSTSMRNVESDQKRSMRGALTESKQMRKSLLKEFSCRMKEQVDEHLTDLGRVLSSLDKSERLSQVESKALCGALAIDLKESAEHERQRRLKKASREVALGSIPRFYLKM